MKRKYCLKHWNEELIPARYGLMEKPEVVYKNFFLQRKYSFLPKKFCKEKYSFLNSIFIKTSLIPDIYERNYIICEVSFLIDI